jgi:hypothetical protein
MAYEVEDLLPDLPAHEPWYELKFQLRELEADLDSLSHKLQRLKPVLGSKEQAQVLATELERLYGSIDHDAQAHAPRAVQLAQHLLTEPPENAPEWGHWSPSCDFDIPQEIFGCRSLPEAQSQVAWHMEQTASALQQAHQAMLSAIQVRGSIRSVLEQVLQQARRCEQFLRGPAIQHAQAAYRWAEPYWRLMDPKAAAAHDARVAQLEANEQQEDEQG